MSDIGISSVNKVLALDPQAMETPVDWLKVYPFVGQNQGLFVADFPKNWMHEFMKSAPGSDPDRWGFWDSERIKNKLIEFKRGNAFVGLGYPYDIHRTWFENYSEVDSKQKTDCLAFSSRGDTSGLNSIEHLDPVDLQVDTTHTGDLSPNTLVRLLRRFFCNSPKIALVDRHQSLIKGDGKPSSFSYFLRLLLQEVYNSKCHEILVYTLYEPLDFPYMRSSEDLKLQLNAALDGLRTPTYGVKYMCCAESGSRETDLHARRIVTNYVVFTLADSIAGRSKSKILTRVPDKAFREQNQRAWIDEDHGLDVVSTAVYVSP